MDCYAIRAQDTFGASEGLPAYLKIVGEVQMGESPGFALSHNQTARIPTGGMLPDSADAVVMVEHTQPWGEDSIEVLRPVAPGHHVVRRGDDVREGQAILPAGHRLRPQDISALAGLGVVTVPVRLPRVAVLSTGAEIVPHTDPVSPGQIRDMNGPALRAAIRLLGAEPLDLGLVTDEEEPLRAALRRGLAEADIVLASGGTSVGLADLMPDIINSLGPPGVLVHGVAVKPGKPVVIGIVDETPIFGLPGHPTSCLVIFQQLVAPLLLAAGGSRPARPRAVRARLSRNYPSQAGREEFLPVRLEEREGEWHATPLLGPSALISTLVRADGLVRIPAEAEGLYAGDSVDAEPLE
jgi:molybdopterin molybdotransferase